MQKNILDNQNFYFKTTPISKIIILTILTFGLYEYIWFYNIWKTLSPNLNYKISPFWRAFFCSITNFFLFPIISKYVEKYLKESFPPIIFASLYLLLNATQRLDEPYWVISFCTLFIVTSIQKQINEINNKYHPSAEINPWNKTNTIWALGSFFLLLTLTIVILGE